MGNKLLIFLLVGVFCVAGFASALEWNTPQGDVARASLGDNYKAYDASERTITIDDGDEVLVEIKLISDLKTLVSAGPDTKVAEFSLINYSFDTELVEAMTSYDLTDNDQEVPKTFWLKYGVDAEVERCMEPLGNKTACSNVSTVNWIPFSRLDELPSKNIRIGLFTDTEAGDYIEWIPTIKGFEITEWAAYTVVATGTFVSSSGLDSQDQQDGTFAVDGYLYTLSLADSVVAVFNVSAGAGNPVHLGGYTATSGQYSIQAPNSVFVNGDYAYVTSNTDSTLVIFDISAHGNPNPVGNFTASSGTYTISGATSAVTDADGDYLYIVSNLGQTLVVLDITDKTNPEPVGAITDATRLLNSKSVLYNQGYAYTTAYGSDYLSTWDVKGNSTPVLAGSVSSSTGTNSLDGVYYAYINGAGIVYTIAQIDGNLAAWDISDNSTPQFLGGYTDTSGEYSMAGSRMVFAIKDYAFVAAFTSNGLSVYNTTNVSLGEPPEPIGWYTDTSPPNSILQTLNLHGADGYVYVGSYGSDSVTQFNFTDLFPPVITDTCTYTTGDWFVSCADNCSITEDVDLAGNTIIINGTGLFDIAGANITNAGDGSYAIGESVANTCEITCRDGGCINF